MIFITGVHGVGKSHLCRMISNKYNIKSFSASKLIEDSKKKQFPNDKKVDDINGNQIILLNSIKNLNKENDIYLLDGHFCLLNTFGNITKIPFEVFEQLSPIAIILLVDDPTSIVRKLYKSYSINFNPEDIEKFQNEEIQYSLEIAERMSIPYLKFSDSDNLKEVYDFIDAALLNSK